MTTDVRLAARKQVLKMQTATATIAARMDITSHPDTRVPPAVHQDPITTKMPRTRTTKVEVKPANDGERR